MMRAFSSKANCFLCVGIVIMGVSMRVGKAEKLWLTHSQEKATTAEASISSQEVTLVAKEHQNVTVEFLVRGVLSACVRLTFSYSPTPPSVVPLRNLTICPQTDHLNDNDENGHEEISLSTSSVSDSVSSSTMSRKMQPVVANISLDIVSRWVGKTLITAEAHPAIIDTTSAYVIVSVIHNPSIQLVSDIFGWTYSIVWDVSFLPQVWLNWSKKSVVGFSLDNVTLNILAYLCYTLYNVALFAVPYIQNQFKERYPHTVSHVRPNDVFFSSYALFIEIVLAIQCCIYYREPGQRVSVLCIAIVVGSLTSVGVTCIFVAVGMVWWLDVFYMMSYIKLVTTPLKYIPQLYVNYHHKSTKGFSMVGLLMDFVGGVMSLAQMFMLSANSDDWISIFTNISKFGLGMSTIFFDLCFFIQHYHYHIRKRKRSPYPLVEEESHTEPEKEITSN